MIAEIRLVGALEYRWVNKMNERDLRRIKMEHKIVVKAVVNPLCFQCGKPTVASTIERGCEILDRWGGVCWGRQEEVPVWKCPNGHITHVVIME